MTKKQKALIILLTPFLLGFLFGFLVGGGCSRKEKKVKPEVVEQVIEQQEEVTEETVPEEEEIVVEDDVDGTGESQAKEIIYYTKLMSYAKVFNDVNETHLEKAQAVGLKKIPEKRDDVDAKLLVKIENTDYLEIDNLRYSVPYLTANAARELNHIAKAFNDSLQRKQFPVYKLVVTSVLRTEEDVTRLRKSGNPNASDNSSHCYGTTFDISHSRYSREVETDEFMQPYELTKVLAEVLRDERNAGRILVKYEKKEHCFHITSCQ
ncbi:MAG: hypothetical protein IKP15_06960 [Bacteroidales bacterium]|nr:hypothetical protein [Bacteroidales bacterium]